MEFTEKTLEPTGKFENIRINEVSDAVRIYAWDGENAKVVCSDSERVFHTAEVENNTLVVKRVDRRAWYEFIGFNINTNANVLVYLPRGEYKNIRVETVSGNIVTEEKFAFDEAYFGCVSGDILLDCTADRFTAKSVSGKIVVKNLSCGQGTAETVSGNIELTDIVANTLDVGTVSAGIAMANVKTAGRATIGTTSGNVKFVRADFGELKVQTVSGNVGGSMTHSMNFETHTLSGNINLPANDTTGGNAAVSTTSGNIEISLAN